jgi:uncharacterized protein YecT (DUF1311 family)
MMFPVCRLGRAACKSAVVILIAVIGVASFSNALPSLRNFQQRRSGPNTPTFMLAQTEQRSSYGGALDECWEISKARIDLKPCLRAKLAEAQRDYEKIISQLAAKLAQLDAITESRYRVLAAFREAQETFQQYKDANCKFYTAEMTSGTGAGDVREACLVDMTQARITEMEKHMDPRR